MMLSTEVSEPLQQKLVAVAHLTGQRILDMENRDAHTDNYFTFVSGSFSTNSEPIRKSIYKHFECLQFLRRKSIDSLRVMKQRSNNMFQANPIKLCRSEQTTPRYPNEEMSVNVENEVEKEQEPFNQKK